MPAPGTDARAAAPHTRGRAGPFDPFLLPSATGVRFFLLVLVAAVGSMYLGVLSLALAGVDIMGGPMAGCAAQARAGVAELPDRRVLDGFVDCLVGVQRRTVLWTLAPGLVWVCLTAAGYAAYPALLLRRLRPMAGEEDAGARLARGEVDTLTGGRRRGRLELVVTPGTAGGARVFGAFGRYWLAVDSSLLAAPHGRLDDRALAVLHHEVAHLRNRDVDVTYLTMASWWAFAALAVPLMAAQVSAVLLAAAGAVVTDIPAPDLATVATAGLVALAATAFTLLVAQWARARVLRTREHYADIRADRPDRAGAGLRRILSRPHVGGGGRWWRGLRRYHPAHGLRLRVLDDPRRLAAVSGADLAVAGLALGAAQLHFGMVGVWGVPSDRAVAAQVAAVLLGLPVGALVTAIVWNAVYGAPRGPHRWHLAAAALAGGVLVGLAPPVQAATSWAALLAADPLRGAVSVLALWAVCLLFLRWAALCARIWLTATERVRAACAGAMACGAPVFGCAFMLWFKFHGLLGTPASGGLDAAVVIVVAMAVAWPLPAAVGGAALLAHTGQALRARNAGRPRLALVPVGAGAALAAGHAALFLAAMPLFAGSPEAAGVLLAAVVVQTVVLAAAVGLTLGACLGGRGRLGEVLCAAAVAVIVLLALQPLAMAVGVSGPACAVDPSPDCWSAVGRALLSAYGAPVFVPAGLLPLLAVCGGAAAAGARLRGAAAERTPHRARDGAGGRVRAHAAGVIAAAAAVAVFLAAALPDLSDRELGFGAEERAEMAAEVVPGSVGRGATCAESMRLWSSFTLDEAGRTTGGPGPVVVTLASSRDPVLAAFGRAALEGTLARPGHLADAVRAYCGAVAGEA
ncbi:M48 family metalloprotease [Streptomonospora sp. S1-112]|uniref:M48 family metalloprotease n=1 Tax=Streptomonospora mangrovi TaxID=2883123 RepID=A0A9X3SMB7_9ACTN|nr:M48 family metalloprotease [Streptomonospora mangrovi]MDA0564191.1 M48 family metalloprotease [Streptomonospora mangrovi]